MWGNVVVQENTTYFFVADTTHLKCAVKSYIFLIVFLNKAFFCSSRIFQFTGKYPLSCSSLISYYSFSVQLNCNDKYCPPHILLLFQKPLFGVTSSSGLPYYLLKDFISL